MSSKKKTEQPQQQQEKEEEPYTEEEICEGLLDDKDIMRKASFHLRQLGDAIGYPFKWQGTPKSLARFLAENYVQPSMEEEEEKAAH